MRQSLVIANWKLHGNHTLINEMVAGLAEQEAQLAGPAVVICPPAVYLAALQEAVGSSALMVGAQNVSQHQQGAYTGELSAAMLADFDVSYVLVGHSERRALFGETDDIVAAKLVAVQQAGMTPVLCVGETLEQREAGETEQVILSQLVSALETSGDATLNPLVIAYEPVWAIGTGKTASPEQAQQVHQLIRDWLRAHSEQIAADTAILYGGSVKADNAATLFAQPDIDGGLVGGASLNVNDFRAICNAL